MLSAIVVNSYRKVLHPGDFISCRAVRVFILQRFTQKKFNNQSTINKNLEAKQFLKCNTSDSKKLYKK